jgi:hypothetical protein
LARKKEPKLDIDIISIGRGEIAFDVYQLTFELFLIARSSSSSSTLDPRFAFANRIFSPLSFSLAIPVRVFGTVRGVLEGVFRICARFPL